MAGYGSAAGAGWRRPTLRQRLGALAITIALELLLLLVVLALGGSEVRRRLSTAASTAVVFVDNRAEPAPSRSPEQNVEKSAAVPTAPAPRPIPPPVLPTTPQALPFVPVSKSDLAAGDIAKLGSAAAAAAGPNKGAAGPGEGPGGVMLYNAEWVVEPSDAQLRPYLPKEVAPGSWALIACQTIAHNRVENCAQLGEAPRGSGLSKAMRLAAWQFQIRPPRIDGKPMVGEWVRIRIDFSKDKEAE